MPQMKPMNWVFLLYFNVMFMILNLCFGYYCLEMDDFYEENMNNYKNLCCLNKVVYNNLW